jgi:hypothetical protein
MPMVQGWLVYEKTHAITFKGGGAMKYQPIPRLGIAFYPDKSHLSEQTVPSIIKTVVFPRCLKLLQGFSRILKVRV